MNSGKVWGSGSIKRLGLGNEYISNANSTTTTEIILIAGGNEALSNIKDIKIILTNKDFTKIDLK